MLKIIYTKEHQDLSKSDMNCRNYKAEYWYIWPQNKSGLSSKVRKIN